MIHTARTPETRCPHCSTPLTAVTHQDGAAHTPSPGDWGVCFGCGGLLRFNAGLIQVAGLASDLAQEPPALRRLIQRMQAQIRKREP